MKSITIKSAIGAPPSFKDPGSAIAAAKEENRKFQQGFDASLYGRAITEVRYAQAYCEFVLDHRYVLSISVDEEGDEFSVKSWAINSSELNSDYDQESIAFNLNGHQFLWKPDEIISAVLGKRLTNLFYNGINIYVYISGGELLSFNLFVTIPEEQPIIHWSFSD